MNCRARRQPKTGPSLTDRRCWLRGSERLAELAAQFCEGAEPGQPGDTSALVAAQATAQAIADVLRPHCPA